MFRILMAGVATAGFVAAGLAGHAQAREFKFNGWLTPVHPLNQMSIFPWAKQVEEATQGRVKITFTPTGVVPPPAQYDAVKGGAVDMAMNIPGFTPGRFKAGIAAEGPFLARDAEPLSVALARTHEKFLDKANEFGDVQLLARFAGAPGYVWSTGKELNSVEDWKGLKLFCGLKATCEVAGALGAVPVGRPGPEVAEVVERKIVDAAFIDAGGYKSFRLDRFVTSAVVPETGFYAPSFYLIMNKNAWNEISAEDKAAIMALSGEKLARKVGADWDIEAGRSFALAKEKNVKIIEPKGEYMDKLRAMVQPKWEADYVKGAAEVGVDGAAALAYLKEQIAAEKKAIAMRGK